MMENKNNYGLRLFLILSVMAVIYSTLRIILEGTSNQLYVIVLIVGVIMLLVAGYIRLNKNEKQ
jgi:hypothetical protein